MSTDTFGTSGPLGSPAGVGALLSGPLGPGSFAFGSLASRAECAYCGAHARPNAMYCMSCGQIVVAPRVASSHPTMQSAAAAAASAGFAGPGPVAPAAPAAPRPAMEQYLLPPVPALPALSSPAIPPRASTEPGLPISSGGSGGSTGAAAGAEIPAAHATGSAPAAPVTPPLVAPPLPRLASTDARLIELELASGERIKIDGTAVLGRRPEATARNAGAQAVVVPDDTMSVSRAHAVIEVQGDAVTVSDAGSANGSAVERDGATLPLRSGRQIVLEHGDRIWLGSVWVDVTLAGASREGVR